MPNFSRSALIVLKSLVGLVSGLLVASAVMFGMIAVASAGLIIGLVGFALSGFRPQPRPAVITLEARRTGRGWSVDPSGR